MQACTCPFSHVLRLDNSVNFIYHNISLRYFTVVGIQTDVIPLMKVGKFSAATSQDNQLLKYASHFVLHQAFLANPSCATLNLTH